MVLSLSLETQFTLLMFVSTVGALLLGARLFLPAIPLWAFVREFLRTDWKYLGVAWIVTAGVNEAAHRFHADRIYTDVVYAVEGPFVLAFQAVTAPSLTVLMSVLYLVGFPFVVLFTYFVLKAHDEREAYRYALAYLCLVLLALPFFLLFPVGVTARYLPTVEPLLYQFHPVIRTGIAATDTLVKAFPSLHAGLSLLAALYARRTGGWYGPFAWVLAGGIVLSTLYLGIHWAVDIVGVVALVALAYSVSRRIDPRAVLPVPRPVRVRVRSLFGVGTGTGRESGSGSGSHSGSGVEFRQR